MPIWELISVPAVTVGRDEPLRQPVVVAPTVGNGDVNVPGPGLTICTNQATPAGVATPGVIVKVQVYTSGVVVRVQALTAVGVAAAGTSTTVAQAAVGGRAATSQND
jgi:hypothetical protein